MKGVFVLFLLLLLLAKPVLAVPLVNFMNQQSVKMEKLMKVGEVELIDFAKPVSLAHYGTSQRSLDYIELEKLEPSANGYQKFMIKAKAPGTAILTFKSGEEIIRMEISVQENFEKLENELNQLFALPNAKPEDRITVISANKISDLDIKTEPHIYLKGRVADAKKALLAVAFAANAVGDKGVKIFSNPGGQLRMQDLSSNQNPSQTSSANANNSSFVEYYDSTNKLVDTNNIYRDLILSSEGERVISFLQIAEPKRFAVKVRFLEMDSKYADDFVSSLSVTSRSSDLRGSLGSTDLLTPSLSRTGLLSSSTITDAIGNFGIARLADQVTSASLVSGALRLFDDTFLNLNINDLLQEGVLRVVNEFSLITHSGDLVSLGKGTRFPVPKLNNGVGNSSITVEYIPIGFKGELKVTGLENKLIDVQLASRLSSTEANVTTINGISIPIFNEEYVNSGALLNNGQEVILNAFMTEAETLAKATSPLGRIIPFIGSTRKKQKAKSLLFIALQAQEIQPSSEAKEKIEFSLPHLQLHKQKNIYADLTSELRAQHVTDTINLPKINKASLKNANEMKDATKIDPLDLEGDL